MHHTFMGFKNVSLSTGWMSESIHFSDSILFLLCQPNLQLHFLFPQVLPYHHGLPHAMTGYEFFMRILLLTSCSVTGSTGMSSMVPMLLESFEKSCMFSRTKIRKLEQESIRWSCFRVKHCLQCACASLLPPPPLFFPSIPTKSKYINCHT